MILMDYLSLDSKLCSTFGRCNLPLSVLGVSFSKVLAILCELYIGRKALMSKQGY